MSAIHCKQLKTPREITAYYVGPDLSEGPLPALVYFSLSGEESLCLDPYNQLVVALLKEKMRIFSFTLPGHEVGLDKHKAIDYWATQIALGSALLADFIDHTLESIDYLICSQWIDPNHLGVAGLSRGAFIAMHIASREKRISSLLGFAPMTSLTASKAFETLKDNPHVQNMDCSLLAGLLTHLRIRFYISNRDTLVETDRCYHLVRQICETAYSQRIRSAQVELILSAPIGAHGHGTSQAIFNAGALWMRNQLLT